MEIRYALARDAWRGFGAELRRLIQATGSKRICEIGGGANPALPLEYLREEGLDCAILDLSAAELEKAPLGYETLCADITAPPSDLAGRFDFVFSRMLAEHIRDPRAFHRGVLDLLAPGGVALHFFPTLYALPFLVNRWLPESLADRVLQRLQPNREPEGRHGKFPAYYRWCRGPGRPLWRRLEKMGYRVRAHVGFFGHSGKATHGPGYWDRIGWLRIGHEHASHWLVRHPVRWLTSYAWLVLEKPRWATDPEHYARRYRRGGFSWPSTSSRLQTAKSPRS